MHIIALENEPSSSRGGQELNLLEICHSLYQRGHSVSLIYVREGSLLERYQEFCVDTVKVDSFVFDRSRLAHTFKFLADVYKISVTDNSVIYSNRYQDIFFGFMLALFKNTPLVCYLQLPPPQNGFPRPLAIGLKLVKRFIAVSNQTKFDWIKSGCKEGKIDVVHNGAEPEVFKPSSSFLALRKEWNIPENTRVISYIGRLDREKGLETLIKAFALLQESATSKMLLLAGKPVSQGEEYKKSLEQLAIDLGLEKNVNFLGHVTNTVAIYQLSDVTVVPSLWSEPFPRTITESMACGTPVVASRTGGIPENLTGEFQSGLFEPGNEKDLLKTLVGTIDWRNQDPQLGERCRQHVLSKFTIHKMMDGIEKVLLSVVDSKEVESSHLRPETTHSN